MLFLGSYYNLICIDVQLSLVLRLINKVVKPFDIVSNSRAVHKDFNCSFVLDKDIAVT
jgi:hypothetical protein